MKEKCDFLAQATDTQTTSFAELLPGVNFRYWVRTKLVILQGWEHRWAVKHKRLKDVQTSWPGSAGSWHPELAPAFVCQKHQKQVVSWPLWGFFAVGFCSLCFVLFFLPWALHTQLWYHRVWTVQCLRCSSCANEPLGSHASFQWAPVLSAVLRLHYVSTTLSSIAKSLHNIFPILFAETEKPNCSRC